MWDIVFGLDRIGQRRGGGGGGIEAEGGVSRWYVRIDCKM